MKTTRKVTEANKEMIKNHFNAIEVRRVNGKYIAYFNSSTYGMMDYKIVNDTEKPYVVGYVISMLNASNSILDYIELSPNVLLPMFKLLLQSNVSFPRELSDQEVAEFKITHKNSLDKVNYRALLNVVAY